MTTTNPYIHTYYVDLRNGADIRREKQPLASGDKNADVFLVHLQDGGKVVSLDGAAVTGKVIRADGQTVPLAGSVADGAAKITLDESCYAVPGEIKLTVTVSAGDVVQSVLIVTMDVQTSETGIVVDNGVIGTLSELLAEIENMRTATQEARETVDAANTALDKTASDAQAAIAQAIRDTDAAVTEIREVATHAAPPIVVEADGALVTIGDGAARPVVRLVSSIAAVQAGSGEPSPENVRAITGWDAVKVRRTGRNLLDASRWTSRTASGVTLTNNGDGSVTVTGTNSTAAVVNISASISLTLKPGAYTVSGCGSTAEGCYSVVTYRRAGAVSFAYGCKTFEIDAEQTVTCVIQVGVGATVDVTLWPMIEAGGSASAFEPYRVAELTAALPETVFGGHLDWVSGLLTVTHGVVVLDGTEAWGSGDGSLYYLLQGLPRAGISAVPPVCSHYPGADVYHLAVEGVQVTPTKVWLRDRRFVADAAGLQAWFAAQAAAGTPVQIVYQLAEPHTIQLAPQTLDMLKGNNTVWSDCGDTAVSYVVDTKTYVDAHAVGGSGGAVASVNGKTGAVVLNAADVGAMPADAKIVDADAREQIAGLSEEIDELKENVGGGGVADAIRYTEQTLTDEQKTQARMNLWQQVPSENLFNKETVVVGEYLAPTGEAIASANLRYSYVPLTGAGTYACAVPGSKLGFSNGNYKKIPIYDAGKNYLMTIEGTSNDTTSAVDNKVVFVVSDADISNGAAYMGFNIEKTMLDSAMVVKAGSYPERYIPYSPTLGIPEFGISVELVKAFEVNPLYGKIATFTGDSICEARENNGGGYATLIGNRNAMIVENLGVSGGRITVGTEKFCITESVNSMRTDADYVILEGGVNDAAANNLGEISNNFSSTLDTATFCGAFEQMVKNAIARFPGKKIGYIAVHRLKQWAPDDYNTNFPNTGYYEAAIKICKKWGIPVCDLMTNCPSLYEIDSLKQAYTTNADGWHPNEEGYLKYYVPKIEAWMKTL